MADNDTQQSKKAYLYPQEDVSYTPMSSTSAQMCGGCRWFNDGGDSMVNDPNRYVHCHVTQNYPLPIRATGWCEEFAAIPEPEPTYVEVLEELTEALANKEHKPNLLERIKALFLFQAKARDEPQGFTGFKSLGGGKWIGWYSNNFEDRESDVFPNSAIDAFINRVDKGISDMPTLRYWHLPVDIGKAKSLARFSLDDTPSSPSLIFAIGEYDDTPIARAFERGTMGKNLKMSHGFFYPESAYKDGVYHVFDTFELSFLPPYAAANPYTLFGDETPMPVLDDNKRKELVGMLGEDLVRDFEQKADSRLKELKEQGVKHKDFQLVDNEARQGISEVKSAVTELATSIKELVTELKAAKPPADDKKKEDDDDKMDKLFGKKKELDDAIAAAKAATANLEAQAKAFNELTPRIASKDKSTEIDPANNADLAALIAANQTATEAKKEFSQLFGGIFPTNGNGAG